MALSGGHGRRSAEERARSSGNAGRRHGRDGLLIHQLFGAKKRPGKLRAFLFFVAQNVRAIEQILLFTTPLATSPQ